MFPSPIWLAAMFAVLHVLRFGGYHLVWTLSDALLGATLDIVAVISGAAVHYAILYALYLCDFLFVLLLMQMLHGVLCRDQHLT